MLIALLLTFATAQEEPLNPDFKHAWFAQRLSEIRTRYRNREEQFFRRELRLPSKEEPDTKSFVDDLSKHPVEDFLIQLEEFGAEAKSLGYTALEVEAAVERILMRGRFVSASTDIGFVEPLLTQLVQDHAASPALAALVQDHESLMWMIGDDATITFLGALEKESPHPTIQAAASLAIARTQIERWRALKDEDQAKSLDQEIVARLEAVRTDHPYSAEADQASLELYSFQNLRVGGRPDPLTKSFRSRDHNLVSLNLNSYQTAQGASGQRRVGRVILLEFWGQWSTPSTKRLMETKDLLGKFRRRPFAAVSINSDSGERPQQELLDFLDESKLSDWMRSPGIVWHHIPDEAPDGLIAREWNVRRWPTNFVIDSEGIIRARNVWGADLEAVLDHWILRCEEDVFVERHLALESESSRRLGGKLIGERGAYLSTPEDSEPPTPGILLVPDAYGLTDHLKLWADRLTTLGFAALVIDPFQGRRADTLSEAESLRDSVSAQIMHEHIDDGMRQLIDEAGLDATTKIWLMGWGFGADFAIEAANRHADAAGTVVWGSPFHQSLTDALASNRKPLLVLVGNRDGIWDRRLTAKVMTQAATSPPRGTDDENFFEYESHFLFHRPDPKEPTSGRYYDAGASVDAWQHIKDCLLGARP